MTELIDVSKTYVGRNLPKEQCALVASVTHHPVTEHEFIRARYRDSDLQHDVDYVLVRHKGSGRWNTYKLSDLNDKLVMESANVS
jgi:hypothetical protein